MDPAERALLERTPRGFLATADADGRPAVVPVCFALVDPPEDGSDAAVDAADGSDEAVEDPRVVTPLDEKPKDADPHDLRRVRDVVANPRVALVADHYEADWEALAWVQVRGTAAVVAPGEAGHAAAVGALRAKYDQYADHALAERPIISVTPGHVVSWAAEDAPGATGE